MFAWRRGARRLLLACVALLGPISLTAVAASAETISFTKQGCEVWTAPAAVGVQVQAVGGAGKGTSPGRGDGVSAAIGLSGGERIEVCVDQGGGASGFSTSHGGGGWSGVVKGSEVVQAGSAVVAAGGGGSGEGNRGGDTGSPGEGEGGGPGTLLSGGAAANPAATKGSALQGGAGAQGSMSLGGGGGGGYFGGGGGGASMPLSGGGGGGGSDFCGNGAIECAVQAAAGTEASPGSGEHQPHVTLTTTPLSVPTVIKVSPNSGPANGDKVSIITGNLKFVTAVRFGGVAATRYSTNAAGTEMGVVSPAQEIAGTVDVTVEALGGTSKITTKDHYKYLPVITHINPNTGPAGVEQNIEIEGAGFKPGETEIFFGATRSENSGCFASKFCLAFSPPLAKGTAEIKVKVNGLTSLKTKAALYTYK